MRRSRGKRSVPTLQAGSGVWSMREAYESKLDDLWPLNYVRNGLVLHIDAKSPESYPGYGTTWYDLSGNNYNLSIVGSPTYNSNGYFTLANNQTTQYMMRDNFATPTTAITYSCWFNSNFASANQAPFTYSISGNNEMLFFTGSSTQLSPHPLGASYAITTSNMTNVWVNFTWSRLSSTGVNRYYRDGQYIATNTASAGTNIGTGGRLIIGQEADSGFSFDPNQNLDGSIAILSVYNRVLTDDEVLQNFNVYRSRFGL